MRRMDNKLGCATLCRPAEPGAARVVGVAAQKQALLDLREAGFDACEFSHFSHLSEAECRVVSAECRRLEIEAWSAHTWVQLPGAGEDARAVQPALSSDVDRLRALGVGIVVIHPPAGLGGLLGGGANAEASVLLARTLGPMAARAAPDISIAIEVAWAPERIRALKRAIAATGIANIGLNIDTGHAHMGGQDAAAAIRAAGDALLTTHLQDNHGEVDEHLPPGQGDIDWADVMAALRDVEYEGVLMAELTDSPKYREVNVAADLAAAHENMRRFAAIP